MRQVVSQMCHFQGNLHLCAYTWKCLIVSWPGYSDVYTYRQVLYTEAKKEEVAKVHILIRASSVCVTIVTCRLLYVERQQLTLLVESQMFSLVTDVLGISVWRLRVSSKSTLQRHAYVEISYLKGRTFGKIAFSLLSTCEWTHKRCLYLSWLCDNTPGQVFVPVNETPLSLSSSKHVKGTTKQKTSWPACRRL